MFGAIICAGSRAEARQSAHIGFIVSGEAFPRHYFDDAMRRLGWVEGGNLAVERRVTGESPDRRKAAAAELVAEHVDLIVAAGTVDARPLRMVTHTIPIVVISGSDLVEAGLVDSLARPGGNVTGIASLGGELDGKRFELLRALLPAITQISVLFSAPDPRSSPRVQAIQALARPLGIKVNPRLVNEAGEFDAAYAASAANRDEAILVQESPLAFENQQHLVALAAQHRLPAVYERRQFVDNGGLVSYGQLWRENFDRAAALVDKVLKGAKPAELPIEQPTHFELVVNLKTARVLGLTVPESILARADEVIE
jgi:putative ABC transport system substrate-binding protein